MRRAADALTQPNGLEKDAPPPAVLSAPSVRDLLQRLMRTKNKEKEQEEEEEEGQEEEEEDQEESEVEDDEDGDDEDEEEDGEEDEEAAPKNQSAGSSDSNNSMDDTHPIWDVTEAVTELLSYRKKLGFLSFPLPPANAFLPSTSTSTSTSSPKTSPSSSSSSMQATSSREQAVSAWTDAVRHAVRTPSTWPALLDLASQMICVGVAGHQRRRQGGGGGGGGDGAHQGEGEEGMHDVGLL